MNESQLKNTHTNTLAKNIKNNLHQGSQIKSNLIPTTQIPSQITKQQERQHQGPLGQKCNNHPAQPEQETMNHQITDKRVVE